MASVVLLFALAAFTLFPVRLAGQDPPAKKILILVEGNSDLKNYAVGDGRQLATLLGHFNTTTTVKGVNKYIDGEMERFDFTFYIGFNPRNAPPSRFLEDVLSSENPVIWMNTGMIEFTQRYNLRKSFGFSVSMLDSLDGFDMVKSGTKVFTKGEPNTNLIELSDRRLVSVLATAYSTKKRKEVPYIIR